MSNINARFTYFDNDTESVKELPIQYFQEMNDIEGKILDLMIKKHILDDKYGFSRIIGNKNNEDKDF